MREETEIHKLVTLLKILVVLIIALIVVELFVGARNVSAATITGEKQLAGFSLLRQKVIDKEDDLPEVEDIKLLAECMYHENWHTDKDHKAAYYTGAVVLNRVARKDFPNTVKGVLYQSGQYITTSKFFTEEIPFECYKMAKELMIKGADIPIAVIFQSTHSGFGSGVWKEINGEYFNYE